MNIRLWDRGESGILPENVNGIIIDAGKKSQQLFFDNAKRLPNSIILLNKYWDNADYKKIIDKFNELQYPLVYYLDEFMTNMKAHNNPKEIVNGIKYLRENNIKLIYGEPDLDKFPILSENEEITLSRYDNYIKIFGCRISLWWTNQIKIWEEMEKKYNFPKMPTFINNQLPSDLMIDYQKVSDNHPDKFSFCWIKLGKDNREQIKWCKNHNKQLMIYSELSKNKLLIELDKLKELL